MSTRSLNDGSSSSCMEAGALENASSTTSDLEMPRSSLVKTPIAAREMKMPAKMPVIPSISTIVVVAIRPPP